MHFHSRSVSCFIIFYYGRTTMEEVDGNIFNFFLFLSYFI